MEGHNAKQWGRKKTFPFSNATRPLFIFFFRVSVGPGASLNETDVILASFFAWLRMLTVSSNSTICSHGSQLGFVTLITLPQAACNCTYLVKCGTSKGDTVLAVQISLIFVQN